MRVYSEIGVPRALWSQSVSSVSTHETGYRHDFEKVTIIVLFLKWEFPVTWPSSSALGDSRERFLADIYGKVRVPPSIIFKFQVFFFLSNHQTIYGLVIHYTLALLARQSRRSRVNQFLSKIVWYPLWTLTNILTQNFVGDTLWTFFKYWLFYYPPKPWSKRSISCLVFIKSFYFYFSIGGFLKMGQDLLHLLRGFGWSFSYFYKSYLFIFFYF